MNGLQEHFFVLLKVQATVLYKQVELKAAGIAPHKELPQQNTEDTASHPVIQTHRRLEKPTFKLLITRLEPFHHT